MPSTASHTLHDTQHQVVTDADWGYNRSLSSGASLRGVEEESIEQKIHDI